MEEEPNFHLNRQVPKISAEEAVVAIYCELEAKEEKGKTVMVPFNWLPSTDDLKQDFLLSAMGLNLAYPEGVARDKLDPKMASLMTVAAIKALGVKGKIEVKEETIPNPPEDPKHKKKIASSVAPRIKRARESNPFAEEQKDKKKKQKAVDDSQPSVPEEGIFQKDVVTEDALVATGKVIRPSSLKEVPAGGDRHFKALTQKERKRRLHGAFRVMYSPSDEEYIMEGDGEEAFNELHNSWLDMSIRMHAASKYMLTTRGKGMSLADAEKIKDELAKEKVDHAATKKTVTSLEGQLETVRTNLATSNTSITDLEAKLANAISQRDSVNRAKNKALEDLSKAKKILKNVQKARDQALKEMKNEEETIVNKWLESEAGERYKSGLRLNGAAEGAGILIVDTLGRAKKVMEELHPGEWATFESRYQALELEEEAQEQEVAPKEKEAAPLQGEQETNLLSSSSSEGGDLVRVVGMSGGQGSQQQQQ